MDFRFRYDPLALEPVSVETGASAAQAGKRVMANVAQPGEYIIVLFGMSSGSEQSVCSDGEIARVIMRTKLAEAIPWGLGLSKATVSASDGTEVASRTTPYQGRNAGTRSPVVAPTLPQRTTSEEGVESSTSPTVKTPEVVSVSGQPPVLLENGGTKVRTSLAETRRVREEILKPNAVSAGQTSEEKAEAAQVAADKADNTMEASSAPQNPGLKAIPVENTGRNTKEGAQVAPAIPKIENDRPKRPGEQPQELLTTPPGQRAGSSSGLWLVAGIGVLAILILVVVLLTRK